MEWLNDMELKDGDIFYKWEPTGHVYKMHVITVLDKEPYPQVVIKWYGIHKQYWRYNVEPLDIIGIWFDRGTAAINKNDIKENDEQR